MQRRGSDEHFDFEPFNMWATEKLANTTFLYKTRWSQKIGPGVPGGPWGRQKSPPGTPGIISKKFEKFEFFQKIDFFESWSLKFHFSKLF